MSKVLKIASLPEFLKAMGDRKPVILENTAIGECTETWESSILQHKRMVSIHVSLNDHMTFCPKNFKYETLPLAELLTRCNEASHSDFFLSPDEKYYLRMLNSDHRKPSNLSLELPELWSDLTLPDIYASDKFFSSVLRISSPGLQIWTHYDVMDNILVQVSGTKTLSLFSPEDSDYLYIKGDKSTIPNIDDPNAACEFTLLSKATKYVAPLQPGDILYIPAFWFHNSTATGNCASIGVNVFWKHLPETIYDQKDPYGNKDFIPVQRVSQCLAKARSHLSQISDKQIRQFYAKQLVRTLLNDED